jgi:outer membrane protein
MTRKALVLLATLFVSAAVSPLAAQTPARPTPARPAPAATPPAPTRVAYLNSRAILSATPGYAAADTLFGRELAASRDEIQRMQQALDSAATDFETASVLLSPSVRQERQRQLVAQQQQLQQRQQELQGRMEARQAELIDPIQQRVQAVIEGIRAELNIAMIFDVAAMQGAMVAADRSLDVTPLVIQRLQAATGR